MLEPRRAQISGVSSSVCHLAGCGFDVVRPLADAKSWSNFYERHNGCGDAFNARGSGRS